MKKKMPAGLIAFFAVVVIGMLVFSIWSGRGAGEKNAGDADEEQQYAKSISENEMKAEKKAKEMISSIRANKGFTDADMNTVSDAVDALCMDLSRKKEISYDDEIGRLYNISLLFYMPEAVVNSDDLSDQARALQRTEVYRVANEVHSFMVNSMRNIDERIDPESREKITSEIEAELGKMTEGIAADKQKALREYTEALERAVL